MIIEAIHGDLKFAANLAQGYDLSIEITNEKNACIAWHANLPKFKAVKTENFIGLVSKGAPVNFRDLHFNPHAHGTHTESFGHIAKDIYSVNKALKNYFFIAHLISATPKEENEDFVINEDVFKNKIHPSAEALIIRTYPNDLDKKHKNYSNTNPPYLSLKAIEYIRSKEIQHLLIDQPSVDREVDGGTLQAHHVFWDIPFHPRKNATITELIYVPNEIEDGLYLLNLQMAAINNDAAPSRPVIYPIELL